MPDLEDVGKFLDALGSELKKVAGKDYNAVTDFAKSAAEEGKKLATDPAYREHIWEAAKETAKDIENQVSEGASEARDALKTASDYYTNFDSDRFTQDLQEANNAMREIPAWKELQDSADYAQEYYINFDKDRFTGDLENIDRSVRDWAIESKQKFDKAYAEAAAQGTIPQFLGSGAAVVLYEGGKELASNVTPAGRLLKGAKLLGKAEKTTRAANTAKSGTKAVKKVAKTTRGSLAKTRGKAKHQTSAVKKCPKKAASQAAQVLRNRQNRMQGAFGEAAVRARLLNSRNLDLVGEQIRITTSGVGSYRVTDFMVRSRRTGRLSIIEVKTGGATRDATQLAKDALIADPLAPTTFIGNRAASAGLPEGLPTGPIRTFEINASNLK